VVLESVQRLLNQVPINNIISNSLWTRTLAFFNSVQKCDIEFKKTSKSSCIGMSQSTEEGGGLDVGASGVIAPREGGLKPAVMGRGGACRATEEGGGLDGGASDVIAPREGGLKPATMGRGGSGRGRGQTPTARKQKSRAE
jgi:hypothetical protein